MPNKSLPGRSNFQPVVLQSGQCKGDHLHFKGAAREVYKYLKLLAAKHGGFVFPSVDNIAAHTKNWKKEPFTYSPRECKRVLKLFRQFGILGDRTTRVIHGRTYRGWQFAEHVFWAEAQGDICELKRWLEYENSFQQYNRQNVTQDVTQNVTEDVTQPGEDVTQDVTQQSDIMLDNPLTPKVLDEVVFS
jgi:hypothetical protein